MLPYFPFFISFIMFLADPSLLFETFFLLLFGHFLADFPLQQEYLSRTKDHTKNDFEIWFISMFAHCMIHAGVVFVLTGSIKMAGFMLVSHFFIDYSKCDGALGKGNRGYAMDQTLHFLVLFLIALGYCWDI